MPGNTINRDYQDLLQKCLAGDNDAFKVLMSDLSSSKNLLSKQDIAEFLFNRNNFLKDAHNLPHAFKVELFTWCQRGEVKLTSKRLKVAFEIFKVMIQDFKIHDRLLTNIIMSDLSEIGNGDLAGIYNLRGKAFFYKTHYMLAFEDYNYAIKLDPTNAHFYVNLAVLHYTVKNYPFAVQRLREAVKLDSQCAIFHVYLARIYLELRDYPAAIVSSTAAIALEPDNHLRYEDRAITYERQKNYSAAVENYISALQCCERKLKELDAHSAARGPLFDDIRRISLKTAECNSSAKTMYDSATPRNNTGMHGANPHILLAPATVSSTRHPRPLVLLPEEQNRNCLICNII